jgi:uncharacterized protein YuzE
MKMQYFEDTDTLYIEFRSNDIVETKNLDENTLLDLDSQGNICAITFEHASTNADLQPVTVEGLAVSSNLG